MVFNPKEAAFKANIRIEEIRTRVQTIHVAVHLPLNRLFRAKENAPGG